MVGVVVAVAAAAAAAAAVHVVVFVFACVVGFVSVRCIFFLLSLMISLLRNNQASRKKIVEAEKVVKKRLAHDAIFRDDFSDSDGDGVDSFEGGGLLPHSELKTKRLVRRHFATQASKGGGGGGGGGGSGEHSRRPSGQRR